MIPSLSHPLGFGSTPPPDPAPSLFRLRLCESHYSFTDDDAAIAVELSPYRCVGSTRNPLSCPLVFDIRSRLKTLYRLKPLRYDNRKEWR